MSVVIQIPPNGREAIPVRAIPLLTNWRFMSPDIVAHVLGGTGGSNVSVFGDLASYRVENGQVQPIRQDWWVQFPLKRLQALLKKIEASEPIYEVGYTKWQLQSLRELPAGAFVWKDDYQQLHDKNWNSRFSLLYWTLKGGEESDEEDEGQSQPDSKRGPMREYVVADDPLKRQIRESLEVLKRWREPDYCPFMPSDLSAVVMEGFQPGASKADAQRSTPAIEAVTEVSAGDANPWLLNDPKDPAPEQPWYTPARYFARQLVIADSTLLAKKSMLAEKVSHSLYAVGIRKKGGKKRHAADTVLKAFSNVTLG